MEARPPAVGVSGDDGEELSPPSDAAGPLGVAGAPGSPHPTPAATSASSSHPGSLPPTQLPLAPVAPVASLPSLPPPAAATSMAAGAPTPIGPAMPGAGPRRTLLRPPPWDKSADVDAGASFGGWLRRQREARQIGLREIAERTKISLRYLEAMEEDRFEVLPAPVFAKGFLREYARYVGLSPDEVVNHWLSSVQAAQGSDDAAAGHHAGAAHPAHAAKTGKLKSRAARAAAATPRPAPAGHGLSVSPAARSFPRWLGLLLGVVVLLGLVAVLAYLSEGWRQRRTLRGEDRPAIVAPVAQVVPPPPAAAAPPSVPLEVVVDFNQECWVEAVVDGGSRRAEMREQGESMQLEAKQSVVFAKLGNAAAVEIQVNGYPYPLDKKRGEVLHDLKIDLDTVRALKAKKEQPEGH